MSHLDSHNFIYSLTLIEIHKNREIYGKNMQPSPDAPIASTTSKGIFIQQSNFSFFKIVIRVFSQFLFHVYAYFVCLDLHFLGKVILREKTSSSSNKESQKETPTNNCSCGANNNNGIQ